VPVVLFAKHRAFVNRILRKSGGIRMHDGIEIRVRGRVTFYPPQGRVQVVMSLIDPRHTLGQMAEARQALLSRLADEGLLAHNGGRPMPALPLRVGLVTSEGSAAAADFTDELLRTGRPFRITLFDCRVQGAEAVDSVAEAVAAAGSQDLDVVVIARGGGARGDLVAFDHERVARAIAGCPHPVVVGVGHETDRSVADEVAHTSAKTPTACAVVLVAAVESFARRLDQATARLAAVGEYRVVDARNRLTAAGAHLVRAATRTVDRERMTLTHATGGLGRSADRLTERSRARLDTAAARLGAADPQAALARGWSITHAVDPDGTETLVRSIDDVDAGTVLQTTTMDGMIISRVTDRTDAEPDQS
jgi:exodeoxyribonuclease VII large subunit